MGEIPYLFDIVGDKFCNVNLSLFNRRKLMKKNYTLNNGYAFVAVETGLQGQWSRDLDL